MTKLTQDNLIELGKMVIIYTQHNEYETALDFLRCVSPNNMGFFDDGNHKIIYDIDDYETSIGTEYNHQKGERVITAPEEIAEILNDEETDEE